MFAFKFCLWLACTFGMAFSGYVLRNNEDSILACIVLAVSFAGIMTVQW